MVRSTIGLLSDSCGLAFQRCIGYDYEAIGLSLIKMTVGYCIRQSRAVKIDASYDHKIFTDVSL